MKKARTDWKRKYELLLPHLAELQLRNDSLKARLDHALLWPRWPELRTSGNFMSELLTDPSVAHHGEVRTAFPLAVQYGRKGNLCATFDEARARLTGFIHKIEEYLKPL